MTDKNQHDSDFRSIAMHTLYESLARERMRTDKQHAREARVARQMAAARRWHRVSLQASAAEARHARRVREWSLS